MTENINSTTLFKQYSLLQQEYQKLNSKYQQLKSKIDEHLSVSSQSLSSSNCFIINLIKLVRNLYNNQKYSDIRICLPDYSIPGHKFVLEANNITFNLNECEIDLKDVEKNIAEQIIRWIYTQEFNDNQSVENLWKVVQLSHEWDLESLKRRCGQALLTKVSNSNCVENYKLSTQYCVEDLKDYSADFILTNWDSYNAADFESLDAASFLELLQLHSDYPLHEAVIFNRDDVVFLSLNRNFNEREYLVNLKDEKNQILLDLALQTHRLDLCKTLLENCADINATDLDGYSLLHKAVLRCDVISATFLIQNGCHLNPLSPITFQTPLQQIISMKSKIDESVMTEMNKVAKLLIDSGTDINYSDSNNMTALCLCILTHNMDIMKAILSCGRCTCINGTQSYLIGGISPATSTISVLPLWLAICKLYRSDYLDINYSHLPSIESNKSIIDIIDLLLEYGADPGTIFDSQTGNSILHEVIYRNIELAAIRLVEWLVEDDGDKMKRVLNSGNFNRETVLHLAVEADMVKVVEILLAADVNPNATRRIFKTVDGDSETNTFKENSSTESLAFNSSSVHADLKRSSYSKLEKSNNFEDILDNMSNCSTELNNPFRDYLTDKNMSDTSYNDVVNDCVKVLKLSSKPLSNSLPSIKNHKRTYSENIRMNKKVLKADNKQSIESLLIGKKTKSLKCNKSNSAGNTTVNSTGNSGNNSCSNFVVDCCTPAHLAVLSGNELMLRLFIDNDTVLAKTDWLLRTTETIVNEPTNSAGNSDSVFTLLLWSNFTALIDKVYCYLKSQPNIKLQLDKINVAAEPLLHVAILKRKLDAVRFLIKVGADLNIRSPVANQATALHRAIQMKDENCVKLISLAGPNLNSTFSMLDKKTNTIEDNISPLWLALMEELYGLATILVDAGCDVDMWTNDINCYYNQSLLHRSIDAGMTKASIFLIQNGCDIRSPKECVSIEEESMTPFTNPFEQHINDETNYVQGDTPLLMACRYGQYEVVEQLLNILPKLDVIITNINGSSALHIAIENNRDEVITLLLTNIHIRTHLSIRNNHGHTAFHVAMLTANQKAAKQIIKHEPNAANEVDNAGRNFLHVAVENHNLEAIFFLISVNAEMNVRVLDSMQYTPLHLAVLSGASENLIRSLVLAGCRIDDLTLEKRNVLHIAVSHRQLSIIDCILDSGALIDQPDNNLDTPLHLAMKVGDREIVEKLLQKATSSVTAKNLKGETILHILAQNPKDNSVSIFSLLLSKSPEFPIDEKDANGNTALLTAAVANNIKLGVALVSKGASLGCVNHDEASLFNPNSQINTHLLQKLLETLDHEPCWIEGEFCVSCFNKFTIKNRKHHCRYCGRLVCGKCSENEVAILKYSIKKPVRVCDICFEFIINGVVRINKK